MENNGYEIMYSGKNNNYRLRDPKFYFKEALTWSKINSGVFSSRYMPVGCLFDIAGCCVFDLDDMIYFVIGFTNSIACRSILKVISPTLNCEVEHIKSLPVKIVYKNDIEDIVKTCISISKRDWDSRETSWDFKRNPLFEQQLQLYIDEVITSMPNLTIDEVGPAHMTELQQSLEVLMDNYCSEWENIIHLLHRNEEQLNRYFIDIYGLQDELIPNVPLSEISILQNGEISVNDNNIVWNKDVIMKQFISWIVGCFMGRYSVDKPGLIIASQGQKVEDLDLPAHTLEIDDDGIIPVIQEEDFFDDDMTQRIETAIKILFGERNFHENMKFIKECLGQELRDYLYKDFYTDHIDGKMYQKRPIYWLFSSKMGDKKKKGYFKALVYMHRIESDTLSKLHADYVSPYLDKIEQQKQEAEDDAVRDDLSQAQRNKANKLAAELADKVREVKEFATILAQMSTQRLTIDLDDGVKTN